MIKEEAHHEPRTTHSGPSESSGDPDTLLYNSDFKCSSTPIASLIKEKGKGIEMSADNFVVVRKRDDGYWWGNFSASYWWQFKNPVYPDEGFKNGPFSSLLEAEENAEEELGIIEYGFEEDSKGFIGESRGDSTRIDIFYP